MTTISVVAPVYNELNETLCALADRVSEAVSSIAQNLELILVDDGSRAEQWDVLCALSRARQDVKGIRLARNFGQHAAIAAGLDQACGDWVVVMDSDLQDRPEVIPELFREVCRGFDIVFVNRAQRPESAAYRLLALIFYRLLNLLSGEYYERRQANFSILTRQVVCAFRSVPDRDRFYGGVVRWLGFRTSSIVAPHGTRLYGKTTYKLRGRIRFAFKIIFGFSSRLLYAAILVGLVMAVLSFVAVAVIVTNKILHPMLPVPGWPSVMTAVFFTARVTNVMVGFVGVYVGNLFEQSKSRPIYVVAQTTASSSEPATGPDLMTASSPTPALRQI